MSERIYRFLLKTFPPRFRDEYADAMMQTFRDRLRESTGVSDRVRLWRNLISDVIVSLPREYCRPPSSTAQPGVYALSEIAVRKWVLRQGHVAPVPMTIAMY